MSHDPTEQRILQNLSSIIGGINPTGGKVPAEMQRAAEAQYLAIMQKRESQQAWYSKQGADVDHVKHGEGLQDKQHQLEVDKAQASVEIEQRKLDLEADRIEVEKAKVIMEALAAAAAHPQLEMLTHVVTEMSYRLLGGEGLPAIEDKSKK